MKLMTEKIEEKLLQSKENVGGDNAEVIVKYFNPSGCGTWLITEGEKLDDGDWLLFGYMHISEWEWGYVLLSELESLKCPPFGMCVERDLYLKEHTTVRECVMR